MVELYNWNFDGSLLWGICNGHSMLDDGSSIHTSKVNRIALYEDALEAYTKSGSHYRCRIEDVNLDTLEISVKHLEDRGIDTGFLKNAKVLAQKKQEAYVKELAPILKEGELFIEFMGIYVKKAFFKKDDVLMEIPCYCHSGMFQDSYLLVANGLIDVRFFDRDHAVDFYHVSDGIENMYIRHVGSNSFDVNGIGKGLRFAKNDNEMKMLKVEDCLEGLFSPDCVNGKSIWNIDCEEDDK